MAFRIRRPSQESFFALNAIPLYSYAIPLRRGGRPAVGAPEVGVGVGRTPPRQPIGDLWFGTGFLRFVSGRRSNTYGDLFAAS